MWGGTKKEKQDTNLKQKRLTMVILLTDKWLQGYRPGGAMVA